MNGGLSSLCFLVQLFQARAVVIPRISTEFRRQLYDSKGHIESTRLYGDVGSYQYYFLDAEIGEPAQRVSLILDTGSPHTGFPCADCKSCGHKHIDKNFNLSASNTAKWDRCTEHWCPTCSDEWCSYSVSYAESSSISGFWFRDYMRLGDSFQENPAVTMHMGCHYVETHLFVTQKANGIMGVQAGSHVLEALFADKEHINTAAFAICFSHQGGQFNVGGYDDSLLREATKPLEWITLAEPIKFYHVKIGSVELVGGSKVSGEYGRTIIDSGTTFTYFPDATFKNYIAALQEYMKSNNIPHTGTNACLRNDADVSKLPDMKFTFSDGVDKREVVVLWKAEDYMVKEDGKPHTCAAFDTNNSDRSTVLGATFMKHKNVVFDIERRKVALPAASCPTYVVRPKQIQPLDANETHPPVEVPTIAPKPIPPVELTFLHILVGVTLATLSVGTILFCIRMRRRTEHVSLTSQDDGLHAIGTVVDEEDIFTPGHHSLYEIESDFEDEEFQRDLGI